MADFHSRVRNFSPSKRAPLVSLTEPAASPHQLPICPECESQQCWKDGYRYNGNTVTQRWICRYCGYRFSGPSFKNEDGYSVLYQVSVPERGMKNLVEVETRTEAGLREATILEYAWKLKKRGLADSTITARTYRLRVLVRKGAKLEDTESVETVLATEGWTQANKRFFVMAYKSCTKTMGINWISIQAKYEPKQPFIPLESEIDQLIAGCGKKTATFLQTLKETGARCGEILKLKWTDINTENSTIAINSPEKHSRSRTLEASSKLIAMLNAMPKTEAYVFTAKNNSIQATFTRQRQRIAVTLQNPRIKQIHFHTFRHWKATIEYHKTRNILYVKYLLGHKQLESTEIYTHLIDWKNDEYHVATAKTLDEEKALLESGFELVRYSNEDKLAIYRKRK